MPTLKKNSETATVDPGLGGTGLAFWSNRTWSEKVPPLEIKNLYAEGHTLWTDSANSLVKKFKAEIEARTVTRVYIEWPKFFSGSVKGWTATTQGDIFKLSYLIGMFAEVCRQLGIEVILVPVNDWKGQLPKRVVEQRIRAKIPGVLALRPTTHSWDAIGIGLKLKGF